jgi:hypothetical protein
MLPSARERFGSRANPYALTLVHAHAIQAAAVAGPRCPLLAHAPNERIVAGKAGDVRSGDP